MAFFFRGGSIIVKSLSEILLESIPIDAESNGIINQNNLRRNALSIQNTIFQEANQEILRIEESSTVSKIATLEAGLSCLRAIKSR